MIQIAVRPAHGDLLLLLKLHNRAITAPAAVFIVEDDGLGQPIDAQPPGAPEGLPCRATCGMVASGTQGSICRGEGSGFIAQLRNASVSLSVFVLRDHQMIGDIADSDQRLGHRPSRSRRAAK